MNWSEINPVLLRVLSACAEDPKPNVPLFEAQWRDRAREFESPEYGHSLLLKVTRVVGVGNDEERFEFEPNRRDENSKLMGRMTATICGIRRITLQLRSETTEETDELWPMAVLQRINDRLNFDRHIATLRDEANVEVWDVNEAVDVPQPPDEDGRAISVATMDIIIGAAINIEDTVPFNWIERVRLSSQVQPSTDITDEQLPPT